MKDRCKPMVSEGHRLLWPDEVVLRCACGLFLLLVMATAATRVFDWDIFWQLQSGKYLWQTQSIIRSDLFTLAADAPRWEHCWLHDLIFYAAWTGGGFVAMGLLKGVLLTGMAAVALMAARARGANWGVTLLGVPPLFLLTSPWWQDRPQLWSYLGLLLTLLLVERWRVRGGRGILWLIPVAVAWANLHAGVLLLLPLLLAVLVGHWCDRKLQGEPATGNEWFYGAAAGALLALAATPYLGADWLTAARFAASGSASGVNLLSQNLDFKAWHWQENFAFVVVVSLAAILMVAGRQRFRVADLLLLGGLGFMGTRLTRHLPFFYLAAAMLLPLYLDAAARRIGEGWPRLRRVANRWMLGITALLVVGLSGAIVQRSYGFFDLGLREEIFPVAAADFIEREQLPGNLFNAYEWGGYLSWRLYPDYRVFWDGRQSAPEMFGYGMQVMGGQDWAGILEKFSVNVVVLPPCHMVTGGRQALILDPLRNNPEWSLVFASSPAVVFVRNAAVSRDWLEQHRIDDRRIDDVSLELTANLLRRDRRLSRAYGERARIFLVRGNLGSAFEALDNYLVTTPPEKRDPEAVRIYQALSRQPGLRRLEH